MEVITVVFHYILPALAVLSIVVLAFQVAAIASKEECGSAKEHLNSILEVQPEEGQLIIGIGTHLIESEALIHYEEGYVGVGVYENGQVHLADTEITNITHWLPLPEPDKVQL